MALNLYNMIEKKKIRVCNGKNCTRRGAERIMASLEENLGVLNGEENEQFCLGFCGCTGYCEKGANVWVDRKIIHAATPDNITERIKRGEGIDKTEIEEAPVEDAFLGDI